MYMIWQAIQSVEKQKTIIASVTLRKHTAMNLKFDIIGIHNIVDRNEIKTALEKFLASKEG